MFFFVHVSNGANLYVIRRATGVAAFLDFCLYYIVKFSLRNPLRILFYNLGIHLQSIRGEGSIQGVRRNVIFHERDFIRSASGETNGERFHKNNNYIARLIFVILVYTIE